MRYADLRCYPGRGRPGLPWIRPREVDAEALRDWAAIEDEKIGGTMSLEARRVV